MDKEEQTFDEFREGKRKKKAQMTAMQNLPYEIKGKACGYSRKRIY